MNKIQAFDYIVKNYGIDLFKAVHKYFKREGTPGHYKYYYTEVEWKKKNGGNDIKEKPKNDANNEQGDKYGIKNNKFWTIPEKEYNKLLGDKNLKSGESYFLRFTSDPHKDFKRNTSVHLTPFASKKEALEDDSSKEYIKLKDGSIAEVLNGIAGYELESKDWDNVMDEIDDFIDSSRSNTNAAIFYDRVPVLYRGKYTDTIPDGQTFRAHQPIMRFGYNEMIDDAKKHNKINN